VGELVDYREHACGLATVMVAIVDQVIKPRRNGMLRSQAEA
jgi:hypothetical protein